MARWMRERVLRSSTDVNRLHLYPVNDNVCLWFFQLLKTLLSRIGSRSEEESINIMNKEENLRNRRRLSELLKVEQKVEQNYEFLWRWMHIIISNNNVPRYRFIWTWYLNSRPRDMNLGWMQPGLGLSTTRIWKPNSKLWSQQQHIWKLITNVTSSVAKLVDSFALVTERV